MRKKLTAEEIAKLLLQRNRSGKFVTDNPELYRVVYDTDFETAQNALMLYNKMLFEGTIFENCEEDIEIPPLTEEERISQERVRSFAHSVLKDVKNNPSFKITVKEIQQKYRVGFSLATYSLEYLEYHGFIRRKVGYDLIIDAPEKTEDQLLEEMYKENKKLSN